MQEQRYSRRRREQIIRRRKRARRRLLLLCLCFLAVLAVIIAGVVNLWNRRQDEKKLAEVKGVIAAGYEEFQKETGVKSTGESAPDGRQAGEAQETSADAAGSGEKFADWIAGKYPDEIQKGLADAAADGAFTSEEAYEVLGSTMHVLHDRYLGHMKDEASEEKYGIYEKGRQKKGNVTVSIAGDLCLEEDGFVIDKFDEVNDLEKCISPEILDITRGADLFYLNHEYTVSDRGEALPGKLYTFRAKPDRMQILKDMGTDLVSLANNHVFDYGEEALLDTMMYLEEADIPYVGGGRNKEQAFRPTYIVVNGMKIGFVAASNAELTLYTPAAGDASPGIVDAYDTTAYKEMIAQASKECDYLIAYIHWGPEDVNQYAQYQTEQGKEFLDAGADIVVGGHPHVLQGMEYMDGKPVIYSMGDFWFNGETKYTGLLNLEITPGGDLEKMSFTPCLQTGFTTQYISDPAGQREMYDFLEGLSPNIKISDDGTITEK